MVLIIILRLSLAYSIIQGQEVGKWLNSKLHDLDYREWDCYAYIKDNKIVYAWAFHSYFEMRNRSFPKNISAEIAIASNDVRWCTKNRLALMLGKFFEKDGHDKLSAFVDIDNHKCIKLLKLAGFKKDGIIRNVVNRYLFSLLRSEFKGLYGSYR